MCIFYVAKGSMHSLPCSLLLSHMLKARFCVLRPDLYIRSNNLQVALLSHTGIVTDKCTFRINNGSLRMWRRGWMQRRKKKKCINLYSMCGQVDKYGDNFKG